MAGRVRESEEELMKISPLCRHLCLLFAANVLGWQKNGFQLVGIASLWCKRWLCGLEITSKVNNCIAKRYLWSFNVSNYIPIWEVTHCFAEIEPELHTGCTQLAQVGQHCRAARVARLSFRCCAPWSVAFVYWNMTLCLTHIYRWKPPVVSATFKSSDNHDSPSFANLYSFLNVKTRITVTQILLRFCFTHPKNIFPFKLLHRRRKNHSNYMEN